MSIDQDSALTSQVITGVLKSLECTMQIISPWNHGSSKAERQIQTIGNMINKHLSHKGARWPLYASMSAYAMNTFASNALQGLSPFELVFARKPQQLSGFELPKLNTIDPEYREFFTLLMNKAKMYRDMDLEWCTLQALELRNKSAMLTNTETFKENDIVYLLAPHASASQSNTQKFRQDYVGPLVIDTKIDETHYLLSSLGLQVFFFVLCKSAHKVTILCFISQKSMRRKCNSTPNTHQAAGRVFYCLISQKLDTMHFHIKP